MMSLLMNECCCDVFVPFVKYFLDTKKISRRVVKKYEHSKEEEKEECKHVCAV